MKKVAKLFIGNEELELTDGLDILYNYSIDDVSDPTAVKNGFSKTIKLMGTPQNNKVFGQYWNVERRVVHGSENSGVYFNASKKAPFQIYINDEVYESGYMKLDKVNTINGDMTYECTLYGDLGNFFLNLNVNDNTGEKLKLSDMDYWTGGSDEFNFTVTASTVKLAWDKLEEGEDGKWQHINFMPAYNGYPADFDADKAIINLEGTALRQTDDSGLWKARDGVVLGKLSQKMTEWEMRDLRSYLQRPVFRMKSIINACCDPDQNGGYQVDLDPDFFSSGNPYYEKTWVTLPMMQNLEYANEEQVLVGSTLIGLTTTGDTNSLMYQDLRFSLGSYGNTTPSNITVGAQIFINNPIRDLNTDIDPIWAWQLGQLQQLQTPSTSFVWFWREKGDSFHTNWGCLGSLYVQMIALNGEVVVGASQAYNLTTPVRHNGKLYFGNNKHYSPENQFKPYMDKTVYDALGEFHDDGWHGEGSNEPRTFYFTIDNLNSPVSQLKMVYFFGASDDLIKQFGRGTFFGKTEYSRWIDVGGPDSDDYGGRWTFEASYPLTVGVTYTNMKAVMGASLGRTGTQVTKQMLLNTEGSPCDYLLSYCKMFGLYFRKDVNTNRIQILSRKSYYQRNNVVNLNDYIDRNKDIKITPVAMSAKWYEFSQEKDETDWQKKYLEGKGVDYGCKILNTGYEFNVEKKKLFDKNILRSGIEGLEKSKYFSAYNNDNVLRTWMGMGLQYNLYYYDTATTVDVPIVVDSTSLPINEGEGMKYYDVFPKLQFHDKAGEPTDGKNVLVFFSGFKNVVTGRTNPLSYYLSDDNMYQTLLNDGTPCWFFSPSETIDDTQYTIKVNSIPVFERYYTNDSSGKVDKSLDFGTAQELYIPDYSITESSCIYNNFWKRYIEDVCDPDTKMLECYLRVDTKVNDEWLRRFYWFDNAIWRINKIIDWNVGGYDTTKFQFIKVQDISNYTSTTQDASMRIRLYADKYIVSKDGETVTLYIDCDGYPLDWRLTATEGVVLSQSSGIGNGSVNVTFPSNNDADYKYWYFTANASIATSRITIKQEYSNSTDFTPSPSVVLVPSSGGVIPINFSWKNQGNDYIVSATSRNGVFVFTGDVTTRRSENVALLYFPQYTGETSGDYFDFKSNNGISKSINVVRLTNDVHFDSNGGQICIYVGMTGATTTDVPYWATTEAVGYSLCFNAIKNDGDDREGYVTITLPSGSSAKVKVSQSSPSSDNGPFNVTPLNLYFPASGGTKFFNVKSDRPWYINGEPYYFAASEMNGDGDGIVAISVGENYGDTWTEGVLFKTVDGMYSKVVYVTQVQSGITGITMTVTPSYTQVDGSGGTVNYTVVVNDMNGLKCSVYGYSTTNNGIIFNGNTGFTTVTVPKNESNQEITYNVTFELYRNTDYVTGVTVEINQGIDGYFLNVNPSAATLMGWGSAVIANVTTNQSSWNASTSDNWLTVTPMGGNLLRISATTNTGATRVGTVNVTGSEGVNGSVVITQPTLDVTLTATPSYIHFDSNGGTATITITSNTNWTIE